MRLAEIKKKGVTEADAVSRIVEYADMKDAAAHPDKRSGEIDECSSLYQALDFLSYSV